MFYDPQTKGKALETLRNRNANQHYFRNCSSQVGVAVDDMWRFESSFVTLTGR